MTKFALSKQIERYIAALSKLYAQDGERLLQEILVNAQLQVEEQRTYDNWNGGTYGHGLFLTLPEALYLKTAKQRGAFQERIAEDLNKLHNVQNEYISEVFLEMQLSEATDWRAQSGLLIGATKQAPETSIKRIWMENSYRVFLSHKAEVKRETSQVKDRLALFGFSCFVAHEDIHPTTQWQDEIENALATMDAFVALMTDKFHESAWTDQEVGYAFARGIPIVAVRLGLDPYGFIGKFQGLASRWENAAIDLAKILIKQERALSYYIHALKDCPSFEIGNVLSAILSSINSVSREQADLMVDAFNASYELRGSFGFNGNKPTAYGPGLLHHLQRWGFSFWERERDGTIGVAF
jgi:TIR domain